MKGNRFKIVSFITAIAVSASLMTNVVFAANNTATMSATKSVSAQTVDTAKKAPVKKVQAKKAPIKKVQAKKAPVKKVQAKKAPVKKVQAKKVPANKVQTKK